MNEHEIRNALTTLADAGTIDETAAWELIGGRIEADRRRQRIRRVGVGLGGLVLAGAAALAVVAAGSRGDPRDAVEIVPAGPDATSTEATVTDLTQTAQPIPFPGIPVVVVLQAGDSQVLALYDGATGQPVMRMLERTDFSFSDVSIDDDGVIRYTEELGDTSMVRELAWDHSAGPRTPYEIDSSSSDAALSPDGSTYAYIRQGVEIEEPTVVLIDTATQSSRSLGWAPDEQDFFLTGGSLGDLAWSPDGQRLVFSVHYEGQSVYTLDADATSLSEAVAVPGLAAHDLAWVDDQHVVGLRSCCYPEFAEPIVVQIADVGTGAFQTVEVDGTPLGVAVGAGGTIAVLLEQQVVLVAPDGSRTTVALEYPGLAVGM